MESERAYADSDHGDAEAGWLEEPNKHKGYKSMSNRKYSDLCNEAYERAEFYRKEWRELRKAGSSEAEEVKVQYLHEKRVGQVYGRVASEHEN